MTEPTEILQASSEVVGCDGGVGALGHPLVYLNIGPERYVDCPYCGRRYVLAEGSGRKRDH